MAYIKVRLSSFGGYALLKADIMDRDTCVFSASSEHEGDFSAAYRVAWQALGNFAERYGISNVFVTCPASMLPRDHLPLLKDHVPVIAALRHVGHEEKADGGFRILGVWNLGVAPPEDNWHFWADHMDDALECYDDRLWPLKRKSAQR